jgi:preprotein translocase subunit SecB
MAEEPQNTEQNGQAGATTEPSNVQMTLQHIYLKDCSFEAKSPHEIDQSGGDPEVNLNLAQRTTDFGNGRWEVILTVTVTSKQAEKTIFVAEVQYGGLFQFENFNEQQMQYAINVLCPNVLYPYNRAKIGDLVVSGGFFLPPMQPINFEAVFRQRLDEARNNQNSDQPPAS